MDDKLSERVVALEVCYENLTEDVREIKTAIDSISKKIDKLGEINGVQNENIAKYSAVLTHESKNLSWLMGIIAGIASGVGTGFIVSFLGK